MTVLLLLLAAVAVTAAVLGPRALVKAMWPEREPVVALWAWQCLVAAALLSCLAALVLGAAAVFETVRTQAFAPAPPAVTAAYDLTAAPPWTAVLTLALACGAAWSGAMLARELVEARRSRTSAARTCASAPPTSRRGCRRRRGRCWSWRTSTRTRG